MAHAMQVTKNAQARDKAREAFEFLACLSPLAWWRKATCAGATPPLVLCRRQRLDLDGPGNLELAGLLPLGKREA
jgi:hypothetical protein